MSEQYYQYVNILVQRFDKDEDYTQMCTPHRQVGVYVSIMLELRTLPSVNW